MSAEDLGRRLLGEVEEAGLDEVLSSIKALADSGTSSHFGIPPLDHLLGVFERHATSPAAQRRAPGSPSKNQRSNYSQNFNARTPAVELTSLGPGAGKTHLLYLITALAILPEVHSGIDLQGHGGTVVFIDTDGCFSVERFVQVMQCHIERRIKQHNNATSFDEARPGRQEASISETEQRSMICHALDHVHILQPQSHAAVLSTLSQLSAYLFDGSAHKSLLRPLQCIILDSAGAFFHPLKAAEEQALLLQPPNNVTSSQTTAAAAAAATPPTTSEAYASLVRELRSLQHRFQCAVIATTASLSVSKLDAGNAPLPTLRPLLPPAFTSFATLRLAVTREIVPAFPPAMSVQEARRERGQRQGVVEQGRVRVSVDGWGADGWGRELTESVLGLRDRAAWDLRITRDGVILEEDEAS
ncbi:uncharacterized protein J3D65DRAFT_223465 [Phyllosticta citribraziliensis]|uniref:DNA recombination and repair protein Rad51-like C-terminal domain-containing protein n=1 Tax=Phyllosticta citribraziliensis TaxID=989973 RepID=A0ABR1M4Y6_9PEZI